MPGTTDPFKESILLQGRAGLDSTCSKTGEGFTGAQFAGGTRQRKQLFLDPLIQKKG